MIRKEFIKFENEQGILLTRDRAEKLNNALVGILRGMRKSDDIISMSVFSDTILIETDTIQTIVKLENQ